MADEAGTTQTSAAVNPADTLANSYAETAIESAKTDSGAEDATTKDSSNTDQKADQGKDDAKPSDAPGDDSKADANDDKPDKGSDPDKDGEDQNEGKDDEDANAASYEDFTLPEGYQLDAKLSEKALPILAKYKVPQEEVQAIVDEIVAGQSEFAAKSLEDHAKLVEGWGKNTKEHFGKDGDAAFEEKSATAKLAMDKFFSPDEMRHIDAWGVGNMPGLFGMAEAIGRAMKEDNSFTSNAGNSNSEETVADIWYPKK